MEPLHERGIFVMCVTAWLVARCSGQGFCNTNMAGATGTLRSENYDQMGQQERCQCILQNTNAQPVSVEMTITFDTQDYENPCDQRFVISMTAPISVCPSQRDDFKVHKTVAHLAAGGSMMLHTLGTTGKLWSLLYQYQADGSISVSCSSSTNATAAAPPCPCGAAEIIGPVPGAQSGDDLGRRLGIGFGVVLSLVAIAVIIFLVLFYLKKRRSKGASETRYVHGENHIRETAKPPMQEKPGLNQENSPVIMDPMKTVPPGPGIYADIAGQGTNMGYTPDEHTMADHPGYPRYNDSGMNSMQNSHENLSHRPPSYHYPGYRVDIPSQPVSMAPDPSALYARPHRQQNRLSLTGQGATGSNDPVYPLGPNHDNEVFVTDTSGSHNNSQNFSQTEV